MERQSVIKDLQRCRHEFSGAHVGLAIDSILAGNTAGELWTVPSGSGTHLLVLWDGGNNVVYLAGESEDADTLPAAARLIMEQIRPRVLASDWPLFKTRALTPWLEERLPLLFAGIELYRAETLFLVQGASPATAPPVDVDGLELLPITLDLLKGGSYAYADNVLVEIWALWTSEDSFVQHGFGSVAVAGGEIICRCTAEYVGPTHCGIGIETLPRFERRGVATATGFHFLQQAQARGLIACWECAVANVASVRVAEKLGFERAAEEMYWRGSF